MNAYIASVFRGPCPDVILKHLRLDVGLQRVEGGGSAFNNADDITGIPKLCAPVNSRIMHFGSDLRLHSASFRIKQIEETVDHA